MNFSASECPENEISCADHVHGRDQQRPQKSCSGKKVDSLCQGYHSESHNRMVQGCGDQYFIGHVNKVVAENCGPNLLLGSSPKLNICLKFQVRYNKKGYRPKKQHEFPFCKLYDKVPTLALTIMDMAKEHIICGAFLFVCCSCEYTKAGGK